MTRGSTRKVNGIARPIKTKKDYSGAASVIEKLNMRGHEFPLVLAGGIFAGIPALVPGVTGRLAEVAPRSRVRLLETEPATGAVRLAIGLACGHVSIPAYI